MEKRVLYAVLNWGLGHATRSVPIIESLLHFGAQVEITSSGMALSYLKNRFPALHCHQLPDREVLYSKKGAKSGLIKRALVQSTINSEQNRFVAKLVEESGFTHIVSDNVYGAYHQRIPSALISHQLSLKVLFGESLINTKLAGWINRFSAVWIPDGPNQLVSGILASSQKVNIPKRHLGIPSRFVVDHTAKKRYRIGLVLGGPEPQRSILEENLLNILKQIEGKKIVFRGSDRKDDLEMENTEFHQIGDGDEMARALIACDLVIGRSGYSSICDLLALGSRALLIPTPNQSEQEYLATRMRKSPQFSSISQEKVNADVIRRTLNKSSEPIEKFTFFKSDSKVVREFLTS
ncbi:MAG: glycosyltransferase family protein [Microcoleaceae cyanobacterium]